MIIIKDEKKSSKKLEILSSRCSSSGIMHIIYLVTEATTKHIKKEEEG